MATSAPHPPSDPERHAPRLAAAGAVLALAGVAAGGWPGGGLAAAGAVLLLFSLRSQADGLLWGGPLARYELARMARRDRLIRGRVMYALVLLLLLAIVYRLTVARSWADVFAFGVGIADHNDLADFANGFGYVFCLAQFFAVAFLTLSLASPVVAEERENKSLDFLLITDLRNREILLGKLLARLGGVGLFVLTGVPVVAFLSLFGGVEPLLMATAFVLTATTALSLAGVAAWASVLSPNVRTAGNSAFGVAALYLGLGFGAWAAVSVTPVAAFLTTRLGVPMGWPHDVAEFVNAGNPVFAVTALGRAIEANRLDAALPGILRRYVVFHGLVFALFGGFAVLKLRQVAANLAGDSAGVALVKRTGMEIPAVRPPVSDRPVLWRTRYCETWRPRTKLDKAVIASVAAILIFIPAGLYANVVIYNFRRAEVEEANIILRVLLVIVGCSLAVFAGGQASEGIARERERDTMDGLRLTGLPARDIIRQKWLGSLTAARPWWSARMAGLVMLAGVFLGVFNLFAIPAIFLAVAAFIAFTTSLGLWISTRVATRKAAAQRYMVLGAGWLLVVTVVGSLLASLEINRWPRESLALYWFAAMMPPATVGFLGFKGADLSAAAREGLLGPLAVCMTAGLAFYAGMAAVFYRAAARRFAADNGEAEDTTARG